jgi:hypothetical protein
VFTLFEICQTRFLRRSAVVIPLAAAEQFRSRMVFLMVLFAASMCLSGRSKVDGFF